MWVDEENPSLARGALLYDLWLFRAHERNTIRITAMRDVRAPGASTAGSALGAATRSNDPAPEGRTTVATGAAQRNPWDAPHAIPPRRGGLTLPRGDLVEYPQHIPSCAPPGRLESLHSTPRVALRSTRGYSRQPLRGQINARSMPDEGATHTDRKYKVRVSTSPVPEHRVRICLRYPTIRDPELALRARHRAHEVNAIRITPSARAQGWRVCPNSIGRSDGFEECSR